MAKILKCNNKLALLLWRNATKYVVLLDSCSNICFCVQCSCVYPTVGMRDSRALSNSRDGTRVVARNNTQVNALLKEVRNGLWGGLSNLVSKHHITQELRRSLQDVVLIKAVNTTGNQHAFNGCKRIGACNYICRLRTKHKLSCTDNKSLSVLSHTARVLSLGRKRHNARRTLALNPLLGCIRKNCCSRVVGIIFICTDNIYSRLQSTRSLGNWLKRSIQNTSNFHVSRGDSTRLVQTKSIYACQRFNTVLLLNQNVFLAKPNSCNSKHRAGEKNKSLRNHANNGSNHRKKRFV